MKVCEVISDLVWRTQLGVIVVSECFPVRVFDLIAALSSDSQLNLSVSQFFSFSGKRDVRSVLLLSDKSKRRQGRISKDRLSKLDQKRSETGPRRKRSQNGQGAPRRHFQKGRHCSRQRRDLGSLDGSVS